MVCEIIQQVPEPQMTMNRLTGVDMSEEHCRSLRDALGGFATGVTVILARSGDDFHGMTANSFTAVSLKPALVLVSISNNAKAAGVIREAQRFSVNLLSEQQEAISSHFAGRPMETAPEIDWSDNQTPILSDALGTFDCKLYRSFVAGDHTLFVGEVEAFRLADEEPLLFFRGKYKRLTA